MSGLSLASARTCALSLCKQGLGSLGRRRYFSPIRIYDSGASTKGWDVLFRTRFAPSPHVSGEARPVFIFHIPKTGGTSVFDTFRAGIGAEHALQISDHQDTSRLKARIDAEIAARGTMLFKAHISPLRLAHIPGLVRTTVLREPVEKTISNFIYIYRRRHDFQRHYNFFITRPGYRGGRFSWGDFETWIREFHFDNRTIRFLVNRNEGLLDRSHMDQAKRALESCELVGVTEELGRYMAILSHVSGLRAEAPIVANRTSKAAMDIDPDELRRRLPRYVDQDAELYEWARGRFASLAAQFPTISSLMAPPIVRRSPTLRERIIAVRRANFTEVGQRVASRLRRARNRLRDIAMGVSR